MKGYPNNFPRQWERLHVFLDIEKSSKVKECFAGTIKTDKGEVLIEYHHPDKEIINTYLQEYISNSNWIWVS